MLTDERFVDTGSVITAAGVSAGIDMALHLVHASTRSSGHARCGATSSTTRSRRSDDGEIAPRPRSACRSSPGAALALVVDSC